MNKAVVFFAVQFAAQNSFDEVKGQTSKNKILSGGFTRG